MRKYTPPFSINLEKFNELMPLLRKTAYWIRFLEYQFPHNKFDFQQYASRAIAQAELLWVKAEQNFHFYHVLLTLRTGKRQDLVSQLGLFPDEYGVIQCAHCLKNTALCHHQKFPILLQRE